MHGDNLQMVGTKRIATSVQALDTLVVVLERVLAADGLTLRVVQLDPVDTVILAASPNRTQVQFRTLSSQSPICQDTLNMPLRSLLGDDCVLTHIPPVMGSEDAYLLMGANPNFERLAKPR